METIVDNARKLRKRQTPQETKLWKILRDRRLEGYKFRRQYVIKPYIVDFCCFENKVIIELDGSGHAEEKQVKYDHERDRYLKGLGYCVLRFWNGDFEKRKSDVLECIIKALMTREYLPSSVLRTPSPRGRRAN